MFQYKEQLVSVIIPVFNGEKFMEKAILSAITQTYPHKEVIVVNDGSTDKTAEILTKYSAENKIRVETFPQNLGAGAAMNAGMRAARGEFIAILAADDIWHPGMLAYSVLTLDGLESEYALTYSDFLVDKGKEGVKLFKAEPYGRDIFPKRLLTDNYINLSTAVIRRKCLDEAGNWADIRADIDGNMLYRLAEKFRFFYINRVLGLRREHSNNLTRQEPLMQKWKDANRIMAMAFMPPDYLFGTNERTKIGHGYIELAVRWESTDGYKPAIKAMGYARKYVNLTLKGRLLVIRLKAKRLLQRVRFSLQDVLSYVAGSVKRRFVWHSPNSAAAQGSSV